MTSTQFTASLLRSSASGFAALAASKMSERSASEGHVEGDLDAWRVQFKTLILELAAAVDDGSSEQFARKVCWTRDAFATRGLETEVVGFGLSDLASVLEDSLPAPAWKPLSGFFGAAEKELSRSGESPNTEESQSGPAERLAESYVEALLEGNARRAFQLVMDAIEKSEFSAHDVLTEVVTGALRAIGSRWHRGQLNVAEEHFATQSTSRLIERILIKADSQATADRTALLTMVEGDVHDLGIRIVAALFELDGWRVISLGANTPAPDIVEAAAKFAPDVVMLGATLNTHREAVTRTVASLKQALPDQLVVIGGAAFASQASPLDSIGADGCAHGAPDAVRLANELTAR